MKKKKSLGKILQGKKSWRKVIKYLHKYLRKYGDWEYIYEFSEGTVKIIITPFNTVKVLKQSIEANAGLKQGRQGRKRKKSWL